MLFLLVLCINSEHYHGFCYKNLYTTILRKQEDLLLFVLDKQIEDIVNIFTPH